MWLQCLSRNYLRSFSKDWQCLWRGSIKTAVARHGASAIPGVLELRSAAKACSHESDLFLHALLIVLSWREVKESISEQQWGKKVFWSEFNIFESPIINVLLVNRCRTQIKCWSSSPPRAQESEREAHKFKAKEALVLRSAPFAPVLPQQRLAAWTTISS